MREGTFMPMIQASDDVRLYAESAGSGTPALMLKRAIPGSGLTVLPQTGHTANLEDPAVFNREIDRFLAAVDHGAWRRRDPRSLSASTTGMTS
jgi:hypothetical protein